MGTIYIIGAGFSKTCGIATDLEMLDALNPMLERTMEKGGGLSRTAIDYLREQNFRNQRQVGFELFMSTLSSLKFLADYSGPGRNIFREEEKELRGALRRYLKSRVLKVDWMAKGKVILDFMGRVDWEHDYVLTFNYDLLLEAAAQKLGLMVGTRIIHLHGAIGDRTLAWPTYTKFAYRTTKEPFAPRWKKAFDILRNQSQIERLVFIGYSMPPSDLEARSLFNYADWYNSMEGSAFYHGVLVPPEKHYSYQILVINPCEQVATNYAFFRKTPVLLPITLEGWLTEGQ